MSHPVVHFEIGCKDQEKTSGFYRQVFGWVIESVPMGMINTGTKAGIAGHIASLGHEPHQFTHVYIETDDVAASLKKVEAEGGKTVVPPVEIPSGTFRVVCRCRGQHGGSLESKSIVATETPESKINSPTLPRS